MPEGERTYLLIHGAYRGGWIWGPLARLLEGEGRRVLAPTLAGHAERHDEPPPTGLHRHVEEVTVALDRIDARDVIAVGHSYGGMVISGLAGARPERLRHLVFVDAPVPRDGQSLYDLFTYQRRAELDARAAAAGGRWLPVAESLDRIEDRRLARWIAARLSPQPIETFREAVRIPSSGADAIPRHYVCFTVKSGMPSPVSRAADAVRRDPRWRYHEIPATHDGVVTHAGDVAQLLLALR